MVFPFADDAVLCALWAYWQAKRGERAMPDRHDIDPVDMPRGLLPYLQLVERVGTRFRYRLTGTAVVEAYGRELTGLFVDEVLPPQRRVIAERHYAHVFDSGQPIYVRNAYTSARNVELMATRVVLPLADGGSAVGLLLMGQTFEYSSSFAARLGIDTRLITVVSEFTPLTV